MLSCSAVLLANVLFFMLRASPAAGSFPLPLSAREDQDDLISIGTIGLIKAVGTFDAGKNARLATYACRCIENTILT